MSISLNTNLAAIQATQDIARHATHMATAQNQLTSGTQLDVPAPDSGRKSLALNLRSALSRTSAATNNVSNALSFLQAQQAGLLHMNTIVGRMAELATQMQDATQSTFDVENYAFEFVSLQREMLDLSLAQFNGSNLFTTAGGADSTMDVIVSEDGLQSVTIDRSNLATVQTYILSSGYAPDDYDLTWFAADIAKPTSDPIGNPTFFSTIDLSLESIAALLAQNGSQQGLLHGSLNSLRQNTLTIEQTYGQAADTDIAAATRELSKANSLMESGARALSKAKEIPQIYLELLTPQG